ncbi:MAG: hypothetical protein Q4F83_02655 [Eubacteriales bacterium]|nr:hypothetical protein [Eubacteriales bacterium]
MEEKRVVKSTWIKVIWITLILTLMFSCNVFAAQHVKLTKIGSPADVERMAENGNGLLFRLDPWEDIHTYLSFTIKERSWVYFKADDLQGSIMVYEDAELKIQANGRLHNRYYLDAGTYYAEIKYSAGHCDGEYVEGYGYFMPASAVLDAEVVLDSTKTYATIDCITAMSEPGITYRVVKGQVSVRDTDRFYSDGKKNVSGSIKVTENGIYSIQVSTGAADWTQCSVHVQVKVNGIGKPKSISKMKAKLNKTTYYYDGKYKKPTVTISGLKQGKDYTVSYKNNKNIGTATVTIKGKGNYTGTLTKKFKITIKKGAVYKIGNLKYRIKKASITGLEQLR